MEVPVRESFILNYTSLVRRLSFSNILRFNFKPSLEKIWPTWDPSVDIWNRWILTSLRTCYVSKRLTMSHDSNSSPNVLDDNLKQSFCNWLLQIQCLFFFKPCFAHKVHLVVLKQEPRTCFERFLSRFSSSNPALTLCINYQTMACWSSWTLCLLLNL